MDESANMLIYRLDTGQCVRLYRPLVTLQVLSNLWLRNLAHSCSGTEPLPVPSRNI